MRYRHLKRALLLPILLMLSACNWPGGPTPMTTPTPTPQEQISLTPGSDKTPACKAADLTAVAGWQGATGSLAGGISFINKSAKSCSLQGRPGVHLLDAAGKLMPVANFEFHQEAVEAGTPTATPDARKQIVTLKPEGKAYVFFVWMNWCGNASGPFKLAVALPGEGGQMTVPVLDRTGAPMEDAPRCDQPNATSTISIGPFETGP